MSEKKDFTKAKLSPALAFIGGSIENTEESRTEEVKVEKQDTKAKEQKVKKQAVKSRVKEQEDNKSPKQQEQAIEEPEFHFKESKLYRNQRVTFYLTQEIYEAMDKTCKEKGISRNEFCNVVFKAFLDGHKQT